MTVAALVAAAGRSMRMGEHKALLMLDGKCFITRIVEMLVKAGLEQIFVTLPKSTRDADKIRNAVNHDVIFLQNIFAQRELLGSVQSVLVHPAFSGSALLVSPVDAPFSSTELIGKLCAASARDPSAILCAAYESQPGHPIVIPKSAFSQVLRLGDNATLRDLQSVHTVDWHDPRITLNINTPDDYARLTNPSPKNFDAAATDPPGVKFR